MNTPEQVLEKIHELIQKNPKYKFEAYSFILAALHFTMSVIQPPRHITGKEFCDGVRRYAIDQFGPIAHTVFKHLVIT